MIGVRAVDYLGVMWGAYGTRRLVPQHVSRHVQAPPAGHISVLALPCAWHWHSHVHGGEGVVLRGLDVS